jgi:dienelactone hydrolase
VTFRALSFQSAGEPATGYLALPQGDGPFPVVVVAHGMGELISDHLDEFVPLVRRGYATLLLDEL